MWCEQCQSDVATEISSDGQQLLCTTCSQPVRKVVAPSLHPETKSAREFLERWAREQQGLKPVAEKPAEPVEKKIVPAPIAPPERSAKPVAFESGNDLEEDLPKAPISKKNFRLDPQHDAPAGPLPSHRERPRRPHHLEKVAATSEPPAEVPPAAPPAPPKEMPEERGPRYRLDEAQSSVQAPHFDVRTVAPQRTVYPGRSEAMWGQLMAYGGVGLLTVGTVFVLWGYFGEVEQYASTGWLMSTAGQMLLLLGIVTLVGGGMQQTTHEVTQRIENLGGRIIRIEESTDRILKAPHFNRTRRKTRRKSADDQEAA
ncbi:hypothetical protein SH661x_003580 [Planctomicrobium sp. SH661]|uniref:hypothetical protein n=1 Tax=Planctomicrobium sp. SH661 TaxID=3448124 RepID=UPI003F5B05A0